MFLPIGDENPRERTPYVNYVLLAANIAAFLLFCFPAPRSYVYALYPDNVQAPNLFTSMFLHASVMHLLGNMLFLWIFGDNVEDKLGHAGYALFYAACGLGAAFLHIVTTTRPDVPMLGASGAISGVLGAYIVFFPRHKVRMLIWFYFWYDVILISAFWWIGIWFLEQMLFSKLGGGVAYYAHIGGFVAGAAIAGVFKLVTAQRRPSAGVPAEIREPSRAAPGRQPFVTLEDAGGIEYVETGEDRYAVLRLSDDLHGVGRTAEITAAATGEDRDAVARRLEATRGMIARGIPRIDAERLQRNLRTAGLPSAIILYNRTNFPPSPVRVESASWDDRTLRLAFADRVMPVPWAVPFLYVAARTDRTAFIDIFANRRSAFRITEGVLLSEVNVASRSERRAGLGDLARAILKCRRGAALNEGIRVLAHNGAWGWLAFKSASDYDEYLFWIYNLILSQVPIHKA